MIIQALKISDLPNVTSSSLDGGEYTIIQKGSTTSNLLVNDLSAYIISSSSGVPYGIAPISGATTRQKALLASLKNDPIFPKVTTDVPTLTHGTTATVTTGQVHNPASGTVRQLGLVGTYSNTYGTSPASPPLITGIDFILNGTTFEISYRAESTKNQPIWVFVDGQPISASPDISNAVSAGYSYAFKGVFGSSSRRRITVYFDSVSGFAQIRAPLGDYLEPAPLRPRVAIVGDSFAAGNGQAQAFESFAFRLCQLLGLDLINISYGGTGYIANGTFYNTYGSAARVAAVATKNPDLVLIVGSVNDTSVGLEAAAAACYAAYADALPDARLIVWGPQPSNATDTIGAARAASIAAVKAAANAAPNVLAFYDMVGTADSIPSAYDAGTTYNHGDRVTYLGSVWSLYRPGGTASGQAPDTTRFWKLETYAWYGTGQVGATTGDGSRDYYLGTDSVHPVPVGANALASRFATDVITTLIEL